MTILFERGRATRGTGATSLFDSYEGSNRENQQKILMQSGKGLCINEEWVHVCTVCGLFMITW